MLLDGELDNNGRSELFAHLSNCEECGNLYSDYNLVKNKCKDFTSEQIELLRDISKDQRGFYKYAFYFSAAASIIFLMLFLFNYTRDTFFINQQKQVDTVYIQDYKSFSNKEKVEALYRKTTNEFSDKMNSEVEYINYIKSLRTVRFNKVDGDKI